MVIEKKLENGFRYLEVTNPLASAKIALQGAHLFHYQAVGKAPLLWVSEKALFQEGKAIRGGIPICWPWFGPHPSDISLPQHGFARISLWDLVEHKELEDGSTLIVLQLHVPWEYRYGLRCEITVGEVLNLALSCTNLDTRSFMLTQALHSYYQVSDIANVTLLGLEGCRYFDQLLANDQEQTTPLQCDREIDRVYFKPPSLLTIKDQNKQTIISSEGSQSVVVWNPWDEKASQMSDMQAEGYRLFICVETANARTDTVCLAPQQSHTLKMKVLQS